MAQHPSEIPSNSINDNQVYNTSCRFNEAAAADQQNPAGKDKERAGRQPGCGHLLRSFVFVRQTLPQVRGGRGVSNSDVSHVWFFFPSFPKRRSTDHGTVPNGFAFFFSVHTNITHAHTHTPRYNHTTDHEELTSNTHTRSCPHTHRQMNRISAHTSRCAFNLEREWNNNGRDPLRCQTFFLANKCIIVQSDGENDSTPKAVTATLRGERREPHTRSSAPSLGGTVKRQRCAGADDVIND